MNVVQDAITFDRRPTAMLLHHLPNIKTIDLPWHKWSYLTPNRNLNECCVGLLQHLAGVTQQCFGTSCHNKSNLFMVMELIWHQHDNLNECWTVCYSIYKPYTAMLQNHLPNIKTIYLRIEKLFDTKGQSKLMLARMQHKKWMEPHSYGA